MFLADFQGQNQELIGLGVKFRAALQVGAHPEGQANRVIFGDAGRIAVPNKPRRGPKVQPDDPYLFARKSQGG